MDMIQQEIEKRMVYLNDYSAAVTKPLIQNYQKGFKGWRYVDGGTLEPVYHDWYSAAMEMAERAVISKKEELNEELILMFGKPVGTLPFYL